MAVAILYGGKTALNLNPAVQTTEHTKYTEGENGASVQSITRRVRVPIATTHDDSVSSGFSVVPSAFSSLKWTALVPRFMALGYLLLVLYFKASDGYKPVHIVPVGEQQAAEAKHTS